MVKSEREKVGECRVEESELSIGMLGCLIGCFFRLIDTNKINPKERQMGKVLYR